MEGRRGDLKYEIKLKGKKGELTLRDPRRRIGDPCVMMFFTKNL